MPYLLILLTCSLLSGCVSCPKATVCFTPGENCTNLIIDSVGHAKKSVLVQAYQFTSKPIAESLVQAKKRGVDIKVILTDKNDIENIEIAIDSTVIHIYSNSTQHNKDNAKIRKYNGTDQIRKLHVALDENSKKAIAIRYTNFLSHDSI